MRTDIAIHDSMPDQALGFLKVMIHSISPYNHL